MQDIQLIGTKEIRKMTGDQKATYIATLCTAGLYTKDPNKLHQIRKEIQRVKSNGRKSSFGRRAYEA